MNWKKRLRALVSPRRADDELDEELRFHLEKQIEQKVRDGMTAPEARRTALGAFGGVEQIKERCRDMRGTRFVNELIQDLRYGLRMFAKTPGFTAVAVLTLALGIGANTAIFSLIDAVLLRLLPVEKPDELVEVYRHDPEWGGLAGESLTNSLWEQVRDQQDVFSGVFAWGDEQFDLARGGPVHLANGLWVSGDFFNTLGLRPASGRLIAPSDDHRGCPAVAVLSYGFWQDHYGGAPGAVGSSLPLRGHPFEVIGVAPPGFYGIEVGEKFDVAVPICAAAIFDGNASRLDDRSSWWLWAGGRPKPGISRAQLSARLRVLSPRILTAALPKDWSKDEQRKFVERSLVAVPLAAGISYLRGQFKEPLDVLMAVVGLVLLIACANIASLMLARAAARHKEIAMRQALGASRVRLIRQLLTECVLLSSAGALLGILFARWGATLLVRFISTTQNAVFLDLSLDGRVFTFTAAVAVLTGLLFGLLPAVRSTRVSLASAMKGSQSLETQPATRFRGRKWIVTCQVALSLVLLVAAGLLLRSFVKLATLDLGFDPNQVLLVGVDLGTANVPPNQQLATYEAIENGLRSIPGVVSAGRSDETPISGRKSLRHIRTDWSSARTGDDAQIWYVYASPGYFEVLRMPLLAGRAFDQHDAKNAPAVAIVNQTLARRFFPNLNPVGRTFRVDDISGQPGPPIQVVGLIRDSKYESVREEPPPTAFFPASQLPAPAGEETFEVRAAWPPSALTKAVQAAVAGVNKEVSLDFRTLTGQVDDSLAPQRLLALLSVFFGALALLLAMIGLYGTLSYLVAQRQREFGVRMALGAEAGSILRIVMRDLVAVLTAGVAAGIGISLAATRVLQRMLFGLGPRDAATILGAAAVLSAAAFVAGYLPARRASRVEPITALRYE